MGYAGIQFKFAGKKEESVKAAYRDGSNNSSLRVMANGHDEDMGKRDGMGASICDNRLFYEGNSRLEYKPVCIGP